MMRWWGPGQVPEGFGPSVVTIGVFDGVHRGHQAIIARARSLARASRLPAVVVTFDPHPDAVVRPVGSPPALSSLARRLDLFDALGVDATLVLAFDEQMAHWSAQEFVERILVDRLHARAVVVGENFRFGHRAVGDLAALTAYGERFGFDVEGLGLVTVESPPAQPPVVPASPGHGSPPVSSSTWIRARIAEGDVQSAGRVLGRPPRVEGVVVQGDRRGHRLGYPTANLVDLQGQAIPADGVYAGWLVRADDQQLPAAVSVGSNPTFDGQRRQVEAYVLDRDDLELYGEPVAIELVERLRGMQRFADVDGLIAQMGRDVEAARLVLAGAPLR